MNYDYYESGIAGRLILYSDGEHLLGINFEKDQKPLKVPKETELHREKDEVLNKAFAWLDDYFAGKRPEIPRTLIKLSGTPFQKLIQEELIKIPYGTVVSYGYIAKKAALTLGKSRMSSQAAGSAVGRNPFGIMIPCHRVVGAKGNLTGFSGGLNIKAALLAHEGLMIERKQLTNENVAYFTDIGAPEA